MGGSISMTTLVRRTTLAACLAALSASAALSELQVPDCGLYTYRGEIVRVIDGDTVVADIDLGFNVWVRDEHLRLNRIDAPETGSVEGAAVTTALAGADREPNPVFLHHQNEAQGPRGARVIRAVPCRSLLGRSQHQ